MDPASLILAVAEKLWGLKNDLSRGRRERRDRVADYFTTIAECLREVAVSLPQGHYPARRMRRDGGLCLQLPETIGDAIGDDVAREQAEALKGAHRVEWLISELEPGNPERETRLGKIEQASGIFDALAATLRAAR